SPGIRTDKWRRELSAAEVADFERVAGAQLAAKGYELATSLVPDRTGPVDRLRRLGTRARRPRAAGRAALDRALARWGRRELHDNYHLVEYLQSKLEAGAEDDALPWFAPRAWVRVVDDGASFEGRGEAAVRELLRVMAEERAGKPRTLSGEIHTSPTAFTTVGTYELADGSRWTRTLVMHVQRRRVTRLALYRRR